VFVAFDVTKRFGPTVALDRVTVEFDRGLNILLGPNGSGKSTLLKLWSGLLKPTSGGVRVFNLDPWRRRADVMRRLSVFFEDLPAPWWLSGEEYARVVAEKRGIEWSRVREYAERLGVTTYWGRLVRGYSSGMRKKLMLLTVLSADVEGYILDEPYTLLDKEALRVVDEIISEKVRDGRVVVVATHILTGVERMVEGFAILHNGRVLAKYPGELRELPVLVECRGGEPLELAREALRLNPRRVEIREGAVYIYAAKRPELGEFTRRYNCVEHIDLATLYRELVKA
jgi:ABC-type multidrug transport system ATPase subunit